jgi:putative hydrolase of HD superfamily
MPIPCPDPRLGAQIAFILEIDKLKTILRQTALVDGSRRENDAEHSWHIATMAFLLAEYADQPVDVARVAKMLLIHDIVEIDAGDTFIHDDKGNEDKEAREQAAAHRLFGLLPADQGTELMELWREFEDRRTADSLFAHSLDRLQPILHNFETAGGTWQSNHVTADKVRGLADRIQAGSRRLGEYAHALIDEAVRLGYLAPGA